MCFIGFNEYIGKQHRTLASESDHTQRQNFVVPTSSYIFQFNFKNYNSHLNTPASIVAG